MADSASTNHVSANPPRDETEAQRVDRNMAELLQELRVAQTGVQLLFGFLLTLAFQQRFAAVDAFGRDVYLFALACVLLSAGFLIAPVGYHRLLFRRSMKEYVVRVSNRCAVAGLVFLLLSLGGSLTVILDVLYDRATAVAGGLVATVFLAGLWFALPWTHLRLREGPARTAPDRD